MVRRIGVMSLVVSLILLPTTAIPGRGGQKAECGATTYSAKVGDDVGFWGSGLNAGGGTRVEMISGTDGSFYCRWGIGNLDSYSFSYQYENAGSYAVVFSTGGNGAWRMKCDVTISIT